MKRFIFICLYCCITSIVFSADYTFGNYATDTGLTGNETYIPANRRGITDLAGLANNFPALEILNLYSNQITNISSGDFDGLSNLQELYLNSNRLTCLKSNSFVGLSSLEELWLHDNQITSIENGAFSGLFLLDELNLNNNYITSVESGDFSGLSSLRKLFINNNRITGIGSGSFNELSNLGYLELYGNPISSIEQGDFDGLSNLLTLSISGGQISNIASGSFDELSNTGILSLINNQIANIETDAFAGLSNLDWLQLQRNQIGRIESGFFSGLSNLQSLELYENQINTIESGSFDDMTNLLSLDLDNNPNLVNLNLNGADFTSLRYFRAWNCPIENVSLVNAKLTQTSFKAIMIGGEYTGYYGVAEISGVKTIDFTGADFRSISDLSKMYTMDDLTSAVFANVIGLDGDEIVKLLNQLDSLNFLDLTGIWNDWTVAGLYSNAQDELLAWDAIEGNTLVIPEPYTLLLLGVGGLLIRQRT